MQKLILDYKKIINGQFTIKPLNLLLVFQVNCPGCFFYAIPLFNELFGKFHSQDFGFLALSTAFEDFDLNTEKNTEALVENGLLVGETKKALAPHGIHKWPSKISFPVGIDQKIEDKQQLLDLAKTIACQLPEFDGLRLEDQVILKTRIANYLNNQKQIATTFTANQLRGTPSFILFNDELEILESWFGHVDKVIVESSIINRIAANLHQNSKG